MYERQRYFKLRLKEAAQRAIEEHDGTNNSKEISSHHQWSNMKQRIRELRQKNMEIQTQGSNDMCDVFSGDVHLWTLLLSSSSPSSADSKTLEYQELEAKRDELQTSLTYQLGVNESLSKQLNSQYQQLQSNKNQRQQLLTIESKIRELQKKKQHLQRDLSSYDWFFSN
jgi:hypothetical protein